MNAQKIIATTLKILFILTLYCVIEISSWKLVWSEEFKSSRLNTNVWNVEVNCEGGGNNELQCYRNNSKNIQISRGLLIITARPEPYNDKAYTSGRIRMKTDGFKYGKFVIRARLPKGKHLWPAIWMLPTRDVYGTWAASGEIDIMEYRGQNTNLIEGTLHFGGKWPNNAFQGSGLKDFKVDFSENFHEFSIEWDYNEIRWYVDNKQYHSETLMRNFWSGRGEDPYKALRKPFDQAFQFLLNVAVGGNFFPVDKYGQLTLEEAKNWPKPTLEVDFIRVYQ